MKEPDVDVVNTITPIQQFYINKCILLTGATGFVGRVLLEKLLRSCPDVKIIFVLIRPKKGKSVEQRISDLLKDKLFDIVFKKTPKFAEKVIGIRGDCAAPGLGIHPEDVIRLARQVSVVFHTAATIRVVEALSVATVINVFGTHELLKICAKMEQLECFLYVSSAFSFCPLEVIHEKIYEGRLKPRELLSVLECENAEAQFDKVEERVLRWCPNVIPFTKGLAENLIHEYGRCFPVAVFRPSMIISTYKEPYSNYLTNFHGPSGIASAAMCGILKSIPCDPKTIANVVPVDMCVNCMIAIAWNVGENYTPPECKVKDCIPVYIFESSKDQPLTWQQFIEKTVRSGLRYPPSRAIWYYSLTLQKSRFLHYTSIVFQHFIPAMIYDTVLFLLGKKTKFWQMLVKMFLMTKSMEFFMKHNVIFVAKNVPALLEKMSDEDRQLFFFDLKKLHWDEYFESYFLGIRLWALKDPMSTVKNARKRYKRLRIMDKIFTALFYLILFYITFCVIHSFIFSFVYELEY